MENELLSDDEVFLRENINFAMYENLNLKNHYLRQRIQDLKNQLIMVGLLDSLSIRHVDNHKYQNEFPEYN